MPPADLFAGADAALDSAGFVAMFRYKGFPWSVEEYVDLAAAHPWAWWASMDLCCEPEVAIDRAEVLRRQQKTTEYLDLCRDRAWRVGVKPPMPVLQGWWPQDYVTHMRALGPLPSLVGLGSVCRRSIEGPDGLRRVLRRLDEELPVHVRLHLFGVKGEAIGILRGHPRIASVDSMAWDFAARKAHRTGRTVAVRADAMRRWYLAQTTVRDAGADQGRLAV